MTSPPDRRLYDHLPHKDPPLLLVPLSLLIPLFVIVLFARGLFRMTDFVRRIVSGNKARYRDDELDLELDLAYITDRVIVMGYPAIGIEGYYRNRREDVKKFLDHRHERNYWVFNFCPAKENSYPADVFEGRVSRYPFPDHHAPPLAVLALVAREMRAWLDGSPSRVAVLHCKAGKGRSGTMACAYLLTQATAPTPSSVGKSRLVREQAKERAEVLMNEMPPDETINADSRSEMSEDPIKKELGTSTPASSGSGSQRSKKSDAAVHANTLEHVLTLHTSGRMKRPSSPAEKVKQGVSIPSQRRWLYYWSLLLSHQGPVGFWEANLMPPKVRLKQLTIRMRELSGVKSNLFRAANLLMDRVGKGKTAEAEATHNGKSLVWASLARYDDELVDILENWEQETRSENGDLGKQRAGAERGIVSPFCSSKWDAGKMVRPFARMGTQAGDAPREERSKEGEKIVAHVLRPLTEDKWSVVRHKLDEGLTVSAAEKTSIDSEEASINEATDVMNTAEGIVLDAHREVRVKLYAGQVFMGWLWFVPCFHMGDTRTGAFTLHLTRKEVDFPLGLGSYLIDVEVLMEHPPQNTVGMPPARQGSEESQAGKGEPDGLPTALQAATMGRTEEALEIQAVSQD